MQLPCGRARWLVLGFVCPLACAPSTVEVSALASEPRLDVFGAYGEDARGRVVLAWANAGFAVRFRGSEITLELTDLPRPDSTSGTDWLAVRIDRGPARKQALRAGRQVLRLSGLSHDSHVLHVEKRTEPAVGSVTVHRLALERGGAFLHPQQGRRAVIEVVGDSITAGYGNEGASSRCGFSPAQQDATRSYAALAARQLGARLRAMAWSGKGVLRNHDPRDRVAMPALFERALPSVGGGYASAVPREPPAAAQVVALGTNDLAQGLAMPEALEAAFDDLVQRLGERAPGAPLFVVLSPLVGARHPHPGARALLRHVLERVVVAASRFRHAELVEQRIDREREGLGCASHPSLATHERLGRELAARILPHLTSR